MLVIFDDQGILESTYGTIPIFSCDIEKKSAFIIYHIVRKTITKENN